MSADTVLQWKKELFESIAVQDWGSAAVVDAARLHDSASVHGWFMFFF